MRITKHTITRMQQALVTYGIAVPVTGEFDGVLQQAYIDWAGRNIEPGLTLYPITDDQVSARLLALTPEGDAPAAGETLDTGVVAPVDPDATAEADAALAELEANALREAEEAKVAAKEAASIAKWAGKADAKAEVEQAQADAAQAELDAAKSHKKAK